MTPNVGSVALRSTIFESLSGTLIPDASFERLRSLSIMAWSPFGHALSDFGLSRVLEGLGESGFTTSGSPHGTLNYMAGELFMSEKRRPDLGTDVFAFGGLILTVGV